MFGLIGSLLGFASSGLHEFLPEIYSETDVGILSSVVCFWFSSRAIEKMRK